MRKVTYQVDDVNCYANEECLNYLQNIKGIISVDIKKDFYPTLTITYDEEKISNSIIYLEICTFLDISQDYSVLSFDYYLNSNCQNYTFDLKGLCCEICYRNIIAKLFNTKGITAIKGDYNDYEKTDFKNIKLETNYDNTIISQSDLEELEKEIRSVYC